jgi:hypothetical protein
MAERTPREAVRAVAVWEVASQVADDVAVPAGHEDDFLEEVADQRLTGLAVAMAHEGALRLSARAHDALLGRHEAQLVLDLRLERALIEAAATLVDAGIPYRALKGPVLAHTVYRDPALRSFGDVDLLVPGPMFDRALQVLETLGYHRRFVEPRSGFDSRFSKGACLERTDSIELDMHRTLAPGAFGVRLGHAELMARPPKTFELGEHVIQGLDAELAFVHACFHAALGDHPPRLAPLRDIVEISATGYDAQAVIDLAVSSRCGSVFHFAIELLERELHVRLEGPLPAWARRHQPTRFDRWALAGYATADRSYARQVGASLGAMRSLRERFVYASALMFPSRDYLRARQRGYAQRMTDAVRVAHDSRVR